YITLSEVTTGLKEGTLHKGSLRINRRNRFDAYVSLDPTPTSSITQDIYICGTRNRNRALDGDTVVVRLLDGEQLEKERAEEASRRDRKRRDDKERQARCDVRAEGEEEATEVETEVEVEESEPAENRIFGKIVYLVDRRSNGEYPGTLSWDSPNAFGRGGGRSLDQRPRLVWFQPTDKRVPLMAIPTEHAPREFMQDPTAYSTILFKASMGRWPSTSQHPFGVVTGTLGQLGEISIETEALLVDAGVTWDTFTDEVISCLPRTPWTIPKEEYAKRRDLRAETIFSIDPPTARDLDDAVSVKPVGEGKFEVGVHIADVSHFVRPGSALDKEARNRATTVYLVQKAIPMLPRLLCEELCSLNPGVERLAFSVIWIMDAQARPVGKPWFGKSVIKSCAKLSYEHAQRIIEGRRWDGLPKVELSGGVTMDRLKADILRFYEFSRMMRQRRFEDGALAINNYKLWFSIDDYGNPYNTGIYEIKEANKLIEEFMLLANMAVAQKISEVFPNTALLRNHARPAEKSMADFVQFAAKLGYVIDPETSASLQQSFENIPDANQRTVLKQLCIKPMQRAKYFCTGSVDIQQWRHFALSVPLYTHFTSPIRRYCDLVVHRMLEVICDGRNEDVYDMKEVAMIAKRCNDMKDASKAAQEASQKLYLCAYLALLSEQEAARVASMGESTQNAGAGVLTEAQVYNIGTRSLDVLVPEFGVEKRVWMEDSIELGDVVGVEDVHGEIGALRIHWNKPTADGLDDDPEGLADRLARLELAEMEREESDLAKT
ncbi:uncharacterized protein EV422DRAFT_488300, partial [Fimicolochytrium jonesii]|uniref:uncharacterized protein n=1 Tax=Fimicolochytrium jonesii TaxID=1396493 RepID=UPI0022FF0DAC